MRGGVKVGQLRDRLQIEENVSGRDSIGAEIRTWKPVDTRRCKIEPISGSKQWRTVQVQPDVTHLISMRHYAGLSPKKHRLTSGQRRFNIVAVIDVDNRHDTMQVTAIEEV